MQPSIWIYTDERNVNAFCCYKNSQNYIALSIALISACWEAVEGFVDSEKISLVFKLNEEKAPYLKNALFFSMLNFVVAHEFGHIAHGHLKAGKYENCIDETLNIVDKENSKAENWDTQLKEYDADTFAIAIQSALFLQEWNCDIKVNLANIDVLFISTYLSFRIFAEKTGRNFDRYMEQSISDVDHPHPGIRMYYSVLLYGYWVSRAKGHTDEVMRVLSSGTHAVIAYDKHVLGAENIKACYYAVAFTEKGGQHIMNLNNRWQELVEYYNQYAYIPIEKLGDIDNLPVSVDENGDFFHM